MADDLKSANFWSDAKQVDTSDPAYWQDAQVLDAPHNTVFDQDNGRTVSVPQTLNATETEFVVKRDVDKMENHFGMQDVGGFEAFGKGVKGFFYSQPEVVGTLGKELFENSIADVKANPEKYAEYDQAVDKMEALPVVGGVFKWAEALGKKFHDEYGGNEELLKKSQELIDRTKKQMADAGLERPAEGGVAGVMYDLGQGGGSMLTSLGIAALTRSPEAAGLYFGAMQKASIYNEARAAGKSPEEASTISTHAGIVEGGLEFVGLDHFIKALKGNSMVGRFINGFAIEATQEASQQLGEEAITQSSGVRTKSLSDSVKDILYNGFLGGFLGGGTNATVGAFVKGEAVRQGIHEKIADKLSSYAAQNFDSSKRDISEFISKELAPIAKDDAKAQAFIAVMQKFGADQQLVDRNSLDPKTRQVFDQYVDIFKDQLLATGTPSNVKSAPTDMSSSQDPSGLSTSAVQPASTFFKRATVPSGNRLASVREDGSISKVYHEFSDFEKIKTIAQQLESPFKDFLNLVTSKVKGAQVYGARLKEDDSMGVKMSSKAAQNIGDFLGGRIIVDSMDALNATVKEIEKIGDVMEVDDFTDGSKPSGYRAVHIQLMSKEGVSVEIQIQPKEIADAGKITHKLHKKWQNIRKELKDNGDVMTEAQQLQEEEDAATSKKIFNEAWEKFATKKSDEAIQQEKDMQEAEAVKKTMNETDKRELNRNNPEAVKNTLGLTDKPVSVLQFIKARGGLSVGMTALEIQNVKAARKQKGISSSKFSMASGELQRIFDGKKQQLGQLISDKGKGLDEVYEALVEAGYLEAGAQDESQAVLDLIEKEVNGDKVYTMDINHKLDALDGGAMSNKEFFDKIGIDKNMSVEQIAEKIKKFRNMSEDEKRIAKDYDAVSGNKEESSVLDDAADVARDLGNWASDAFTPISTRLGNIHQGLKHAIRRFVFDVGLHTHEDKLKVLPFIEKVSNQFSEEDYKILDFALKNSDKEKVQELLKKYNIEKEFEPVREVLDSLFKAAGEVGLDMNYLEEYFPRKVKRNMAGLYMAAMRRQDYWSEIEAAMEEADPKGLFTREEQAAFVNQFLRGFISSKINLSRPSFTKERGVDYITPEFNQYYQDSMPTLIEYIGALRHGIEARKMFGKTAAEHTKKVSDISTLKVKIVDMEQTSADVIKAKRIKQLSAFGKSGGAVDFAIQRLEKMSALEVKQEALDKLRKKLTDEQATITPDDATATAQAENSIGAYVNDLVKQGLVEHKEEDELKQLLKGIIEQVGTRGWVNWAKNATYIYTMGNPLSALTQIKDLAFSLYKNGFYRTGAALARSVTGNQLMSKEELGIDNILQEFEDETRAAATVRKVFKLVGITTMDNIGKEVYIEAAYNRLKDMAARNDAKFDEFLNLVFDKEANTVKADLLAGKMTDDVKYILFSELSDIQPISIAEMPLSYATGGNWRLMYMLKSYTVRQFDIFRREALNDIFTKDPERVKKGLGNLLRLSMCLLLVGVPVDALKDFLLGRDTDYGDLAINNLLNIMGFSKYTIYKTRTEGIQGAVISTVVPPILQIPTDIGKDIKDIAVGKVDKRSGKKTKKPLKDSETLGHVPVIGKFYYWWAGGGAAKEDRKHGKNKVSTP